MYVRHSRVQHGVGQGSFHSATVEFEAGNGRHRFDYVYDCGALKSRWKTRELRQALNRVSLEQRETSESKAVLDLLILSHFDGDHMNGAKDLVERFCVDRIVVPYLGVDELALVIASHADVIDQFTVAQLHGLANGADTFLGRPVTQVNTGPRERTDNDRIPDPLPGFEGGQSSEQPGEDWPEPELPRRVSIDVKSPGSGLAPIMSDEDSLTIGPVLPGRHNTWKLRFWNRGMDSRLARLIHVFLGRIGFPIAALSDKEAGAQAIVDWLNIKVKLPRAKKGQGRKRKQVTGPKSNRDLAVQAYRLAIQEFAPIWLRETTGEKLSNFLSLGLYSGSGFSFSALEINHSERHDDFHRSFPYWSLRYQYDDQLVGWMGTGDAPLGEADVWTDFEAHYKSELAHTQTVVIPHHGAAPAGGTRFYNPGLNHRKGVNSVISCGARNLHGHPHPTVIAGIDYACGQLVQVTEDTQKGFQETYLFEPEQKSKVHRRRY